MTEEELKCTWVALLFLPSYMSALHFWTDQWEKLKQNEEIFNKIIACCKLLLLKQKQNFACLLSTVKINSSLSGLF